MIPKITRGSRVGDIAAYLHGPGNRNEHVMENGRPGGEVIASNIGAEGDVSPEYWAPQLRAATQTRTDIKKPVWHVSLRAAPDDPKMDNAQWAQMAREFVDEMGLGEHPWVAVQHGDDHVHIVASRVDDAGQVWHGKNDYRAAQRACTALEKTHGLTQAPRVSTPQTKRRADHQVTVGEWRASEHTGTTPPRVVLAEKVRACAAIAQGRDRERFEFELDSAGVQWRANVAATGRMSGYSFALPGNVDERGEQVWFKASALDKGLSWASLQRRFAAEQVVHEPEPPKRQGLFRRKSAPEPSAWTQKAARATPQSTHRAVRTHLERNGAWWKARQNGLSTTKATMKERQEQRDEQARELEEALRMTNVMPGTAAQRIQAARGRPSQDAGSEYQHRQRMASQQRPQRGPSHGR